jgi:hypothetical protein
MTTHDEVNARLDMIVDALKNIEERLSGVEKCVYRWHGVAVGIGITVSAVWAIILAGLNFFKKGV